MIYYPFGGLWDVIGIYLLMVLLLRTYFEGAGNTTLLSACNDDPKAAAQAGRSIECWSTAVDNIRPSVSVVKG